MTGLSFLGEVPIKYNLVISSASIAVLSCSPLLILFKWKYEGNKQQADKSKTWQTIHHTLLTKTQTIKNGFHSLQ